MFDVWILLLHTEKFDFFLTEIAHDSRKQTISRFQKRKTLKLTIKFINSYVIAYGCSIHIELQNYE